MQLASRTDLFFDSPDGHYEETAWAVASRFETPQSCDPSKKRRRASVGTIGRSFVRMVIPCSECMAGPGRHRSRNYGTMTGSTCVSCQTGFLRRQHGPNEVVWHIAAIVEGQMARTDRPAWRLQQRLASEVDLATRSAISFLSPPFKSAICLTCDLLLCGRSTIHTAKQHIPAWTKNSC